MVHSTCGSARRSAFDGADGLHSKNRSTAHSMDRSIVTSMYSAVALAALVVSVVGSPIPGTTDAWMQIPDVFADDIDDQVTQLRELAAAGDDAGLVARIKGLERRRDKRVDDALMVVVRAPKVDAAAREAMRVLGLHGDPGYLGWAKSKLADKKMLEDRPDQYFGLLDSLAGAGGALKPYLRSVAECVSDNLTTKPDVARRAVTAYASAGSEKSVIDQLIDWLDKLESAAASGGGGRRGGLTSPPPESGKSGSGSAANTQPVKDEVLKSLARLTGASADDSSAWRVWWAEHKASFKPAPPRAAEPDWALLEEFADDAFGFVLKKPVPPAVWGFERCEAPGGRVRLRFQDAAGQQARVDAVGFKKGRYATAGVFAQHVQEEWRKNDYSDFFGGGEPAVSTQQIGGREFTVIKARGVGAGAWKDWDGCERRLYVTALDADTFLSFEAVVRVGFAETQKAALWAAVEAVTFTNAK